MLNVLFKKKKKTEGRKNRRFPALEEQEFPCVLLPS